MRFKDLQIRKKVINILETSQQPFKNFEKNVDIKLGPPYPPDQMSRVKDMQTKLEKLGYSVGATGIDGKFGKRTSNALLAFIKDYNLPGNYKLFDKNLEQELNRVVTGQRAKVKNSTPVNNASPKKVSNLQVGNKNHNSALREPGFIKKLNTISQKLGVDEQNLLKIMKFESNLNPQAVNPYTKATGLIQFMPNTAKDLGTTIEELYEMSAVDQLDYVEKYYSRYNLKAGATLGDLYMLTFMPAAANKPNNFVLGNVRGGTVFGISASNVYRQNKIFDSNNDGIFTKLDVIQTINQKYG